MTRTPNLQTPTLANVAFSNTSVQLFPAMGQAARRIVVNDADQPMLIAYGATAASTTNFSVKLVAGQYYEFPVPTYGGVVQAIWLTATTGAARTTTY